MQAFIEQDDEVIMIEPYFDIFKPSVEVTGGKTVTVKLNLSQPFNKKISANHWKLDMGELRSKISPRTKAIILNTPHNPTGKVFNESELKEIAEVAKEHNLLVISDEVVQVTQIFCHSSCRSMTTFTIPRTDRRVLHACLECGSAH
jgi:kynurenine aminotransferase